MISRFILTYLFLFLSLSAFSEDTFHFPRAHFAHEHHETEWWYYTGHLTASSGEEFGYELTFFKVAWPEFRSQWPKDWKAKPVYLAHFAISHKTKKKFFYKERVHRPIGNIAGASASRYHVWIGDWSVEEKDGIHHLTAQSGKMAIRLRLTPAKPPVKHGINGISHKGSHPKNYSNYYSFTRLNSSGELTYTGKSLSVKGLSWMDHEWMNNKRYTRGDLLPRWDWFSFQLSNNTEIMFYKLRDKDNNVLPASKGTLIYADNSTTALSLSDVKIEVLDHWESPRTKGVYPIRWIFSIPGQKIRLDLEAAFNDQELITTNSTRISYWEGAVKLKGIMNGRRVTGLGYVEMTGYAKK